MSSVMYVTWQWAPLTAEDRVLIKTLQTEKGWTVVKNDC